MKATKKIKAIWIANILIPDICKDLNIESVNFGGWLEHSLKRITGNNIEVVYIAPYADDRISGVADVRYYTFSQSKMLTYDITLKDYFKEIIENEQPDIIHIWGSEYPHSLSMAEAALSSGLIDRCVVSIQGILNSYIDEFNAGLPKRIAEGKRSLKDFLKGNSIVMQKEDFINRSKYEKMLFESVRNVIGRTLWDRTEVLKLNKNLNYYFCNETLRENFYKADSWTYDNCKKFTIFLSQASYPIKGFHKLLDITDKLLLKYPELEIRVTGKDYMKNAKGFRNYIRLDTYGRYIYKRIKKTKSEKNIKFLGSLNNYEMQNELLKCNLFLSPSSIENSSNSIGEAMLLGVPIVASNVGGTPSIINDGSECILYSFNNSEELYKAIVKIFNEPDYAVKIGNNAKMHAKKTHNTELNMLQMSSVYDKIMSYSD